MPLRYDPRTAQRRNYETAQRHDIDIDIDIATESIRMTTLTGNELVGETLRRMGVEAFFFLMGGPMNHALKAALDRGIRGVDVRHEQAAAMMAHAYARVTNRPGLCMGASGPGTINLTTGLANALVDCSPVVAFGGGAPVSEYGTGTFQEIDQVAIMQPVTKWAERIYTTARIPEFIDRAFRTALSGKPGPVFLDLPQDVLYGTVDEASVQWPDLGRTFERARPAGDPALVAEAIRLLAQAERPLVLSGSGVFWSDAPDTLRRWLERTGMPICTTPQGRGILPEDHPDAVLNSRSTALRDADFLLVVGTRLNYVFNKAQPPRVSGTAKMVRIDIDPGEIAACDRAQVGIVGDAGRVLTQMLEALPADLTPGRFAAWRSKLAAIEAERRPAQERDLSNAQTPIHPLRLCKEVRDFMDRDAILCVDGQEILNFGRQSIPTFFPRHRLNSGTFGTMGVGLPFGIGAKVARPDKQVIVLHGDGSFGLNGLELDTAMRHRIPVLVVISLNGGWTADPKKEKPGRDLGYTRFDLIAKDLGCHGEFVEKPEDIRPALERAGAAVKAGRPALVNVVTDHNARATTTKFSPTST
jgi:thiamine pyrophosphate-dependent acetolactate synthase large subunit-like protein